MKNRGIAIEKQNKLSVVFSLAILILAVVACNHRVVPPYVDGIKTSTDEGGRNKTTKFRKGESIHIHAKIESNPGTVEARVQIIAEEVEVVPKGEKMGGPESGVDILGNSVAYFSSTLSKDFPAGKFKVVVDLYSTEGEKLDSESVEITVE